MSQDSEQSMPKVLSFALRKGGICRTTSVFNISYAAAMKGLRVLMVDLDSQHNLTDHCSAPEKGAPTIYDALAEAIDLTTALLPTSHNNLFILPGDEGMSSLDFALGEVPVEVRFQILKRWFLGSPGLKGFDLVTMDMGPSMNGAMINALVASTHFISPIRSDFESLNGLTQLFREMSSVVSEENPALQFLGAFMVDFDGRNQVPRRVEAELQKTLEQDLFQTRIRANANFGKAAAIRQSIFEFERSSINPNNTKGRDDVMNLTQEILERLGLSHKVTDQNFQKAANE